MNLTELERELLIENEAQRLEIEGLRAQLAESQQCLEDVCIGTRMRCEKCGNLHPCMCDK